MATAVAAGALSTDPAEIIRIDADIFSPNALGGVLDDESISQLQVEVVCGGANNPLVRAEHADLLAQRGILYAPDYIVNAGGVIAVSDELHRNGHSPERCRDRTEHIGDTLRRVFAMAEEQGMSTAQAAHQLASERIELGAHRRRFLLPTR